jgi:hypothetical protein
VSDVTHVLVAEKTDTAELASCLAQSYWNNPLFRWMFAEELAYPLLRGIFTGLVDAFLPQRCVYKAPDNVGVAIWNRQRADIPADHSLVDPPLNLETSTGRRIAALAVLSAHRPTEPHMYLAAVGVLSTERRRGLATALLDPVLREIDSTGVDAYLENSDPKNTSFYEGLGFRSVGSLPMPAGCPPIVGMTRKAESQTAN